jgi:carbon storage regulator
MLVLGRHRGEGITLTVDGRRIRVKVADIRGQIVRLGFEADRDVIIHRDEIQEILDREDRARDEGRA